MSAVRGVVKGRAMRYLPVTTLFVLAVAGISFACGSADTTTTDGSSGASMTSPTVDFQSPSNPTENFNPAPDFDFSTFNGQASNTRSCAAGGIVTSYWERTNFCETNVNINEIFSGGPPPNGIPAIYSPQFESLENGDAWLSPNDPVISLEVDGDARAYPLAVLTRHEIVNDVFADQALAITYCPLCNAAIVFNRRVGEHTLAFGTSGNLRNSDLVMFDDLTESWWQQLTGQAIVGDYVGTNLEFVTSLVVSWEDFKLRYPDGTVIRGPLGTASYFNPYEGYDSRENPFLFRGPVDDRLSAVDRVAGITINGVSKAYPFSSLENVRVVNDTLESVDLVVFWKPGTNSALDTADISNARDVGSSAVYESSLEDGTQLSFSLNGHGDFVDDGTGSMWDIFGRAVSGPLEGTQLTPIVSHEHLWFSWQAFMPQTELWS